MSTPPIQRLSQCICLLAGADDLSFADGWQVTQQSHRYQGNNDFYRLIAAAGLQWRWFDVVRSVRDGAISEINAYGTIFNLISDPDQNDKCLALAAQVERGTDHPVLNSPQVTMALRRDEVARRTQAIDGLSVPRTLYLVNPNALQVMQAMREAGFTWPAIVRRAGVHGGKGITLVSDESALADAMESPGSYYLTEFRNYVSKDGLFRKWRFFYIGGEVVFRSLFIGKSWNLHVRDRRDASSGLDQQETYREERRMLDMLEAGRLTGIVAMLRAMAAMLRLDYFGVDCALTSPKTAILFEANATMNFGNLDVVPERPHKARMVSSALQATRRLLENSSRISAAPSTGSRERRSWGDH